MGIYIYLYANISTNVCICVIYTGSIPGVAKDVFYRAKEGTKIHWIYSETSLK